MIVVIADDFTGAAELGGIGLRHGLRTEVCVEVPVEVNDGLELLVVATDTRSKAVSAAVADMLEVTRQVLRLAPEFVYKKTDSVLRGHVVAELKVHMGVLGMKQTLLVPANPVLGRVVRHGHYFVNGIPVHETSFAEDPEFPVRSNDVKVMLGGGAAEIVVGDAETPEDLWDWAGKVGPGVLAAGAASFFSAILDRRRLPVLYVSGTTFDSSRERIRQLYEEGGPVLYMPIDMDRAVRMLREGKLVVGGMRTSMGKVIAELLSRVKVGELIIEGGSTAYAILQAAGLSRFVPEQEVAQGVVRMRAKEGMLVTVKPGSYGWPDSIRY